jgi:Asp-tRNA(Asn)/Glu-tRNA(Gln) amidotransferase A subunit family amidase
MQIVGKAFDEPMVFKVGDAYQRITEWHLAEPPSHPAREAQLV